MGPHRSYEEFQRGLVGTAVAAPFLVLIAPTRSSNAWSSRNRSIAALVLIAPTRSSNISQATSSAYGDTVLIAPTRSSNGLPRPRARHAPVSSSLLRGVPTGRPGGAGGPPGGSSSLLRGVPTPIRPGRMRRGRGSSSLLRGVPTRGQAQPQAGLVGRPHRSYEEFQPLLVPDLLPGVQGPHRSCGELLLSRPQPAVMPAGAE